MASASGDHRLVEGICHPIADRLVGRNPQERGDLV